MIYIISILIILRLCFWIFGFSALAMYKSKMKEPMHHVGVSILICVKNNLEGIKVMLPKLLKQNYDQYEIILMDDFSNDGLKEYFDTIDSEKINYYRTNIDLPGKKQSVIDGVSYATFDWILQTDSDCQVSSLDWIKHMMSSRYPQTDIVLGVSPLKSSGTFFSYLASYESIYIAMQYLSYTLFNKPYMGVGRNILFRKEAFCSKEPYKDNMHLASGDDDLLVSCLSNGNNVELCIEPNAMTYSYAPTSVVSYFNQKSRHVSTASKYPTEIKSLLSLFGFLHISIYLLLILGFLLKYITLTQAAGSCILLWSMMFIIQLPIFSKLGQKQFISWVIIADIFLAIFYTILSFQFLLNRKQQEWK
jgi:glycosyltransferase involved in cell wall biosynthesis